MKIYTKTGAPFYKMPGLSSLLNDATKTGTPWCVGGVTIIPPITGHIKSINGVPWEHVKSYNSVLQSHIKTALGVEG